MSGFTFTIKGSMGGPAMQWCLDRGHLQGMISEEYGREVTSWLVSSDQKNPYLMPDISFTFEEHEAELAMLFKLTWVGK